MHDLIDGLSVTTKKKILQNVLLEDEYNFPSILKTVFANVEIL